MTTQTNASGIKPTHRLYIVTGTGKSASWRDIGAAWPNKDGNGFSLTLEALPIQGRIVMRAVSERTASEGGR